MYDPNQIDIFSLAGNTPPVPAFKDFSFQPAPGFKVPEKQEEPPEDKSEDNNALNIRSPTERVPVSCWDKLNEHQRNPARSLYLKSRDLVKTFFKKNQSDYQRPPQAENKNT